MRDRNKPSEDHIDPDDVVSWELPTRSTDEQPPASRYFAPPTHDLDLRAPTLPPPPPRTLPDPLVAQASVTQAPPAMTSLPPLPSAPVPGELAEPVFATPSFAAPDSSWIDNAPNAEVRDFPESAKAATPFRPELREPAAVIDLSDHTDHPYNELYDLGSQSETTDVDAGEEPLNITESRELPDELRHALLTATAASNPSASEPAADIDQPSSLAALSSMGEQLPPPPLAPLGLSKPLPILGTTPMDALGTSSMISVDTLGAVPLSISGLFTDVLTDNGFKPVEVNQATTVLARGDSQITIDMLDDDHGAIVELECQDPAPIQRLFIAGFIEAGFTMRSSDDDATVLGHEAGCLVRLLSVDVDRT